MITNNQKNNKAVKSLSLTIEKVTMIIQNMLISKNLKLIKFLKILVLVNIKTQKTSSMEVLQIIFQHNYKMKNT